MSVSKNDPNIHDVLGLFISSNENQPVTGSPAESALFEQRIFVDDPAKYQVFMDRLNGRPAPNVALCETMLASGLWEEKK